MLMTRCQIDGRYLKRTSLNQLGRDQRCWVQENTNTQQQPITYWLPFGVRRFGIWPADACGGKQVTVTGPVDIQPYTNSSQMIPLANDLLGAFDSLAINVLVLKEAPAIFKQSTVQYQQYLRLMKKMTVLRDWKAPVFYVAELQQPQDR